MIPSELFSGEFLIHPKKVILFRDAFLTSTWQYLESGFMEIVCGGTPILATTLSQWWKGNHTGRITLFSDHKDKHICHSKFHNGTPSYTGFSSIMIIDPQGAVLSITMFFSCRFEQKHFMASISYLQYWGS